MRFCNQPLRLINDLLRKEWIFRFDRRTERRLFFYATLAMLLLWVGLRLA